MRAFFVNSRTAVVEADKTEFNGTLPELEKIASCLYQYGNVADCSFTCNNKIATIIYSLTEDALKFAAGLLLDPSKKKQGPSKEYLDFVEHQKNKPINITDENLGQLYRKDIDSYDPFSRGKESPEESSDENSIDMITPEELKALKQENALFGKDFSFPEEHPDTKEKYEEGVSKTPEQSVEEEEVSDDDAYTAQVPRNIKFKQWVEDKIKTLEKDRGIPLSDTQKENYIEARLLKNNMTPDLYWEWLKYISTEDEEENKSAFLVNDLYKFADDIKSLTPGKSLKVVDSTGKDQDVEIKPSPDGGGDTYVVTNSNDPTDTKAIKKDSPEAQELEKASPVVGGIA